MKKDTLPFPVKATGDPWKPDDKKTATVPIPNAVIKAKIEGPYTEHDRKLWTFLVHTSWNELLTKPIHEILITEIDRLFRDLTGGHNTTNWIWASARRLNKTIVEWEECPDADRMAGISNLMNARTSKTAREAGVLWYEIPALLSQVIKAPFQFSRIRLHFMIGLSGKYSVTLYELLESVANMKNPVFEVNLPQLRQWLKVPEGKLPRYVDLKRRILEPAVKQINDNPDGAGFRVEMEAIFEGNKVDRVRFSMIKTEMRLAEEAQLKQIKDETFPQKAVPGETPSTIDHVFPRLSPDAYEKAKAAAPGYDVYGLETEWRVWIEKTGKSPDKPEAAFIGFCRRKALKQPISRG